MKKNYQPPNCKVVNIIIRRTFLAGSENSLYIVNGFKGSETEDLGGDESGAKAMNGFNVWDEYRGK